MDNFRSAYHRQLMQDAYPLGPPIKPSEVWLAIAFFTIVLPPVIYYARMWWMWWLA